MAESVRWLADKYVGPRYLYNRADSSDPFAAAWGNPLVAQEVGAYIREDDDFEWSFDEYERLGPADTSLYVPDVLRLLPCYEVAGWPSRRPGFTPRPGFNLSGTVRRMLGA